LCNSERIPIIIVFPQSGSTTNEGVPYLRPEIQLLYKAGSSEIREKDNTDFQNTLPYLLLKEKEWLRTSLTRQFPEGHAWLEFL